MSLRCAVEGLKAEVGGTKGEEVGVRDMSGIFCFPGVEGAPEDVVEGAASSAVPCTSRFNVS